MKITILGAGAYALALATMIKENNHEITIWTKLQNELEELKNNHTNNRALPNYVMPDDIKYTMDLEKAVSDSELIIFAIPTDFIDDVAKDLSNYYNKQHICIASKGIEQDTCLFADSVVKKYIKTDKLAVISGPSFASDIIKKFSFLFLLSALYNILNKIASFLTKIVFISNNINLKLLLSLS